LKALPAFSQFPSGTNYEESKVLPYVLPDPLLMTNGKRVRSAGQWMKIQRPYIYHLFEKNVYGDYPRRAVPVHYRIRESSSNALGGIATRKQVRIFLKPQDTTVYVDVLMYLPHAVKGPAPVFLGYNFMGNATVIADPAIFLSDKPVFPEYERRNDSSNRGMKSSRWPIKTILANGFGVVTACNSDIEADNINGRNPRALDAGIRTTLKDVLNIRPGDWGAIGAWAWGLSRIMDYLEKDTDVNAKEVAVVGHSRLGKTALWAGASDQRFSIIISNESGEGGAALARRWYGETVESINNAFPYWFVPAYKKYNDDVFSLPVDQHELLALIAPRPLYIASAEGDQWSDPRGEFLSAWHAGEVYALFGEKGTGTGIMPPVNHPVGNTIQYHIRTGKHDITLYDWEQYIKFARRQWKMIK
jgi:hypothetical protein